MALIFGRTIYGISAVKVETAEDMYTLRDEHADWHEGALSILSFPSHPPQGFLSHDLPKAFGGGPRFLPGAILSKDEAGNFGFVRDESEFVAP